jgi:hypothetical protein
MTCKKFENRILNDLLPEFCDHPSKSWGREGFNQDAVDFLRGIDGGLIKHVGNGQYMAPRSSAKEMFFWVGSKNKIPRPITLWAEPIITVAAFSRLHYDLGWPSELIGMQSVDWAFDLVAFQNITSTNEYIACEIKKSVSEVDQLIKHMTCFGSDPGIERPTNGKALNAYKKVLSLLSRRAPLFWVVGPNNLNHVFKVEYGESRVVKFNETTTQALSYSEFQ